MDVQEVLAIQNPGSGEKKPTLVSSAINLMVYVLFTQHESQLV